MEEHQLTITELLPSLEYAEVKRQVVKMLKQYPKIQYRIESARLRADGLGRRKKFEEKKLSSVGKAYTANLPLNHVHREKAASLFHQIKGNTPEDTQVLDEINEVIVGTRVWGYEGGLDSKNHVIPGSRAKLEYERLQYEQEIISYSLDSLKSYAPHLHQILYDRFINGYTVFKISREMKISESTYDNWLIEAIYEFAMLVGITEG